MARAAAQFPALMPPLIHERDVYLGWSCKRSKAVDGAADVVGVMGRNHLRGVAYTLCTDQGALRFKDLVRPGGLRRYRSCGFVVGRRRPPRRALRACACAARAGWLLADQRGQRAGGRAAGGAAGAGDVGWVRAVGGRRASALRRLSGLAELEGHGPRGQRVSSFGHAEEPDGERDAQALQRGGHLVRHSVRAEDHHAVRHGRHLLRRVHARAGVSGGGDDGWSWMDAIRARGRTRAPRRATQRAGGARCSGRRA
eukprot:scaffold1127_cov361-Prasinococcus_capsulatus_cf.AAC.13